MAVTAEGMAFITLCFLSLKFYRLGWVIPRNLTYFAADAQMYLSKLLDKSRHAHTDQVFDSCGSR